MAMATATGGQDLRRRVRDPFAERRERPSPGQHCRHRRHDQRRQAMAHAAPVRRTRHPCQVFQQARALASQDGAVTGRQIRKLLQGRADQGR